MWRRRSWQAAASGPAEVATAAVAVGLAAATPVAVPAMAVLAGAIPAMAVLAGAIPAVAGPAVAGLAGAVAAPGAEESNSSAIGQPGRYLTPPGGAATVESDAEVVPHGRIDGRSGPAAVACRAGAAPRG